MNTRNTRKSRSREHLTVFSQVNHTRMADTSACTGLSRRTQRNPPAATLRLQQRKFDRFRHLFNHERPHEGLNNETPGSLYQPSTKIFPRSKAEYVYSNGFITRRVNNSGDISWHKGRVFISEVFRFEELGFEEAEVFVVQACGKSWTCIEYNFAR